jgi:23S rRNA (pseudouridine1915-N3)-methyltransferase
MLKIDIIVAGRLRPSPLLELWNDYTARMQWQINLHEIESKNTADLETKLLDKIKNEAFTIILDERGKSLSSRDFAVKLDNLMAEGQSHIQFIIGEADGLPKTVKQNANFLLAFGIQTWPHMLVRIMLIEQIYRAQQILAGHPYHRD